MSERKLSTGADASTLFSSRLGNQTHHLVARLDFGSNASRPAEAVRPALPPASR
ncbi:hypothetical protein [Haloplanus halobius]|uniref:hypothetical protein n=1 Tax=Haloplanus halobius TaxID=2934938 RepID=UPI002010A81E|nr:hypothetical protein [Haloplanus sp. XH21]